MLGWTSAMPISSNSFQVSIDNGGAKKSHNTLVAASGMTIAPVSVESLVSTRRTSLFGGSVVCVATFLVQLVALETVRRFSEATCPFLWNAIQALQVLGFPPFRMIQRWSPVKFVVEGIQRLSIPLLFMSITTIFRNRSSKATSPSNRRIADADLKGIKHQNRIPLLMEELDKQQITLPDGFHDDEILRFYNAANEDLSSFISSIKKTIKWRENFKALSLQELERWSDIVFWHGYDSGNRPCLVIRLGLVLSTLSDKSRFSHIIVSQIDHGILHLTNEEDPRITVLLDCQGTSTFGFPMQMVWSFIATVRDNYPFRLGMLFIVHLSPLARVIAHAFLQAMKPITRQQTRLLGESDLGTLSEFLPVTPAYLYGNCTCSKCHNPHRNPSGHKAGETATPVHQFSSHEILPDTIHQSHNDAEPPPSASSSMCAFSSRARMIGFFVLWIVLAFLTGLKRPKSFLQKTLQN